MPKVETVAAPKSRRARASSAVRSSTPSLARPSDATNTLSNRPIPLPCASCGAARSRAADRFVPVVACNRAISTAARSLNAAVAAEEGTSSRASLAKSTMARRSSASSCAMRARAASRARSIFAPAMEPERSMTSTAFTAVRGPCSGAPAAATSISRYDSPPLESSQRRSSRGVMLSGLDGSCGCARDGWSCGGCAATLGPGLWCKRIAATAAAATEARTTAKRMAVRRMGNPWRAANVPPSCQRLAGCGDLQMGGQELGRAPFRPEPRANRPGHESEMAAPRERLERDLRIGGCCAPREAPRRDERIVLGGHEQERHADPPDVGPAGALRPVILRVLESVDRRGQRLVELEQGARRAHPRKVDLLRGAARLLRRLALQAAQEAGAVHE